MLAEEITYQARVTNNSKMPYKEMFKGEMREFKPGETQIWPDLYEAVQFRGQFNPSVKDENGTTTKEKAITVERIEETRKISGTGYINPLNGKKFATLELMQADVREAASEGGFEVPRGTDNSAQTEMMAALLKKIEALEAKVSDKASTPTTQKKKTSKVESLAGAKTNDPNGNH